MPDGQTYTTVLCLEHRSYDPPTDFPVAMYQDVTEADLAKMRLVDQAQSARFEVL